MNSVFDFLTEAIATENLEHDLLENESSEYYNAVREAKNYYEQIEKVLPPEMRDMLLQLDNEWDRKEVAVRDVYYRKGFCDAVRLIMQTLVWEPRKS